RLGDGARENPVSRPVVRGHHGIGLFRRAARRGGPGSRISRGTPGGGIQSFLSHEAGQSRFASALRLPSATWARNSAGRKSPAAGWPPLPPPPPPPHPT